MNFQLTRRDSGPHLPVVEPPAETVSPAAPEATEPNAPRLSDIPPAVLIAVGVFYAAIIVLLWLGFSGPEDASESLGVSTFVILMFLLVPLALARTAKALPRRLGEGLAAIRKASIGTATGSVSGPTAMILILTVPVALTLCAAAIAIVFRLLR
jgi:hypothetical protein